MSTLDHKVPPPVIAILCAALAWVLVRLTPGLGAVVPAKTLIVGLIVLAGVALDVSGFMAFRKAQTTLDPRSPEKSTSIVSSGPYRFTRNPMYLGMVLVLLGFCAYLANPVALVAVAVFVAYITRFQIIPEERLLLGKFGEAYAQYAKATRRWI